MNFKIYRCTGKVLLPIATVGILSGSIYFEYPNEFPHWRKEALYHSHEHIELNRYFQPKLNMIVNGATTGTSTSTSTTSTTFTTTTS